MTDELQARIATLEVENASLRALHKQTNTEPKHETSASPAICRVAVKLPPLWPDRVAVWFAQAEAQFLLAGINTDETMYCHILSQIDHKIAAEIEDIVINPPAVDKYQKLKSTLISRFSTSEEERIRRLLSDEELGDRKPSQFLRHLRSLAGTTFSDENLLRQLWIRRLPQHAQGILVAQSDLGLDRIADIADKILEAQPNPAHVYATSTPPITKIMERLEELSLQVAALTSNARRERSWDRASAKSGPSPRSLSPQSTRYCWYHRKFGTKAKKCVEPCIWKSENTVSSQ